MKKVLIILSIFVATLSTAQSLEGSWKLISRNGQPVADEFIKIYQEGYFAYGAKKPDNSFIEAGGGIYTFDENEYTETLDFFTAQPDYVGQKFSYKWNREGNLLTLKSTFEGKSFEETWELLDNSKDDLSGNWVITGRKRNGEISENKPGNRRTIKILGGGRFQWVAFNSETKEFMGSGGGSYTAENGKYVENIKFFSRDNNRVGAALSFDFEIVEGKWHHSGKSSKGDPIYEIWSDYRQAYLNQ